MSIEQDAITAARERAAAGEEFNEALRDEIEQRVIPASMRQSPLERLLNEAMADAADTVSRILKGRGDGK